jgi:hypothetical protein
MTESARASSTDDKWRSLKAFRRAKGLCQYCAEKWVKDHKCADNIQFNVMQELLAVFQDEDEVDSAYGGIPTETQQLFLTLSVATISGIPAPRTLCLSGSIQGHQINVLVDSGSSHSFLSSQVASQLAGISSLPTPLSVKVANGQVLDCSAQIMQAEWSVQNFLFTTDLKVIALATYDMTLGMDWLEMHNPMKVYWQQKWLSVPYHGSTAMLYGNRSEIPAGTVIHLCDSI